MNNKVLVKLILPELDAKYDIFIPVNEVIWKIKLLLLKSLEDIQKITLNKESKYYLINKTNCRIYNSNEIVIDTDIRNGCELILTSINN